MLKTYEKKIPRADQETSVEFERWSKKWKFFSNDPVYIRKWHDLVDIEREAIDPSTNNVVSIEGYLKDANVIITKKHHLTDEQRARVARLLKEGRMKANNK